MKLRFKVRTPIPVNLQLRSNCWVVVGEVADFILILLLGGGRGGGGFYIDTILLLGGGRGGGGFYIFLY